MAVHHDSIEAKALKPLPVGVRIVLWGGLILIDVAFELLSYVIPFLETGDGLDPCTRGWRRSTEEVSCVCLFQRGRRGKCCLPEEYFYLVFGLSCFLESFLD